MANTISIPTTKNVMPLLLNWCEAQSAINICVLFGSVAKNSARATSDIDVALWCKTPPSTHTYLSWISELSLLCEFEVNVVLISADTNPVLGFEIVRDGHLIFERQPDQWAVARSRLWHHYVDTAPFRRLQEQQLRKFAREFKHVS